MIDKVYLATNLKKRIGIKKSQNGFFWDFWEIEGISDKIVQIIFFF
jgi:hypothetical protein